MNIHCPNCQKELMIPDQYANQQMKCPLCQGTFMAPSLPDSGSASSPPTETPSPEPAAPAPEPAAEPAAPEKTFSMQPQAETSAPEDLETDQPAEQPQSTAPAPEPTPAPASTPSPAPSTPTPEVPRPTQCTKTVSMSLDPNTIQWVAVAAIVVIFVMLFFPWISIQLTSTEAVTQNGWQVGFGGYSVPATEEDMFKVSSDSPSPDSANAAILVYDLLFVILLLVAGFAAALSIIPNPVPALQSVVGWRWSIVAGLCFFLFFLLCLQLVMGFSLETSYRSLVADSGLTDSILHRYLAVLRRNWPVSLVFWCHLLATLCTGFLAWLDIRKTQPIPKIEIHY